jgi:hypothetical protein
LQSFGLVYLSSTQNAVFSQTKLPALTKRTTITCKDCPFTPKKYNNNNNDYKDEKQNSTILSTNRFKLFNLITNKRSIQNSSSSSLSTDEKKLIHININTQRYIHMKSKQSDRSGKKKSKSAQIHHLKTGKKKVN